MKIRRHIMKDPRLKNTLIASSVLDIVIIACSSVSLITIIAIMATLISNANKNTDVDAGTALGQGIGAIVAIIILFCCIVALVVVLIYCIFTLPSVKMYKLSADQVVLKKGRLIAAAISGIVLSVIVLVLTLLNVITQISWYLAPFLAVFVMTLASAILKLEALKIARSEIAKPDDTIGSDASENGTM